MMRNKVENHPLYYLKTPEPPRLCKDNGWCLSFILCGALAFTLIVRLIFQEAGWDYGKNAFLGAGVLWFVAWSLATRWRDSVVTAEYKRKLEAFEAQKARDMGDFYEEELKRVEREEASTKELVVSVGDRAYVHPHG